MKSLVKELIEKGRSALIFLAGRNKSATIQLDNSGKFSIENNTSTIFENDNGGSTTIPTVSSTSISTASLISTGASDLQGNVSVGGTLTTTGISTLNADTDIDGDVSVTGASDLQGDVTVGGNFTMTDTQWTDLKVPLTRDKQGQSSKPDFDFTNLGLLFPQNDEAEEVYMIIQFGHDYKLGTDISPHLHYIQDEAGTPKFEMTYRWIDNGETVGSWATIESTTNVFSYTSGSIMNILEFPTIDGSSISGVSSMIDIIIRRQTGDGITGDVLVKEFDIHYEISSLGSDTEYVK